MFHALLKLGQILLHVGIAIVKQETQNPQASGNLKNSNATNEIATVVKDLLGAAITPTGILSALPAIKDTVSAAVGLANALGLFNHKGAPPSEPTQSQPS
jgi:hypothetical protein